MNKVGIRKFIGDTGQEIAKEMSSEYGEGISPIVEQEIYERALHESALFFKRVPGFDDRIGEFLKCTVQNRLEKPEEISNLSLVQILAEAIKIEAMDNLLEG